MFVLSFFYSFTAEYSYLIILGLAIAGSAWLKNFQCFSNFREPMIIILRNGKLQILSDGDADGGEQVSLLGVLWAIFCAPR